VVITSAFQADEKGPIPLSRSKLEIYRNRNFMTAKNPSKKTNPTVPLARHHTFEKKNEPSDQIPDLNQPEQTIETEKQPVINADHDLKLEAARLKVELNSQKAELANWQNQATRYAAEIQNQAKQFEFDLATAKKSAKKSIITLVLSFLNTLNLAFAYTPQTDDATVQKFVNTLKFSFDQMISDFKVSGVEIVIPQIGEDFNGETMSLLNSDAVTDDSHPQVKQIISLGLKIDGQLVQPAAVMV
jgi:molecular chaperone GrpE (heat shock protein)